MSNNITPDMLIQYLDNELPGQERLHVESQLASDPELQQQLEKLKLAQQAFKMYARRQHVSSIHAEMMKELPRKTAAKAPVRILRMAMRAAALVLVLLVIAGLVQYSLLDANRLYRSQYGYYTLGTSRDAAGVSALEKSYREHNTQQVIALYESNASKQPGDHFLAGQTYLSVNDPQKAIAAFEAQLKANEAVDLKPYQDDAEYYLALAWLRAGRTDKALPLFEKIHNQPAHAYHDQVSGWYLTKLRWLQRKQS
jgi:tetratricopeptide (TPR) repeat protein